MSKGKKQRKGGGQKRVTAWNSEYTDRIGKEELRKALTVKLSIPELAELERELKVMCETVALEAEKSATEEAYKRQFAVMMRVMHDRFGFGKKRMHRLWDACLDYIHDIDEGLMTTEEMLKTLENEDRIRISWRVM